MTQFQLGSVSHGTLRPQDLMPAFLSALADLRQPIPGNIEATKYMEYVGDMFTTAAIDEDDEFWDSEEVQFDMDDLIEALNNNLPPFVYFGTLEGDGSDFGFWVDRDALDEAITQHDVPNPDRDGCQVLEDYNVIVQVSDHGNVTMMDMDQNVIWAVV